MKNATKTKITRNIMLFWTFFIGIGAFFGGICMELAPDGSILSMQAMLPYFKVLPFSDLLFQNYIFPGIALLIVNGISNLTAAVLIIAKKRCGAYLGCIFGITLMLWITIQFIIFPANMLSISYFIFGALQFIDGILYIIFLKRGDFSFDKESCEHIGENNDILVVYFSRLGYTEKVAYEKAEALGAQIFRITTSERTHGFLGFAWLGRFGMHKWAMPINELETDITAYKKVVIVTPVHCLTLASPVKGFCQGAAGKIKDAESVVVHFTGGMTYTSVFDEIDKILGISASKRTSVTSKFGKTVCEKNLPAATKILFN